MPTPVRVLILEDRNDDAALLVHALRQADFDPDWKRVETEVDFLDSLSPNLDLILADYNLPQFDALQALHLLQNSDLDIPFIVVTGTIEEVAVACMKQGAADYLLKDRLARLGPAVKHALHEKQLRVARRVAEAQLHKLSRAVEQTASVVIITDANGTIEYANPAFYHITGYTPDEVLGKTPRIVSSGKTPPQTYEMLWDTITSGEEWHGEFENEKKNGERYWVSATISPIKNAEGVVTHFVGIEEDITERRRAHAELQEARDRLKHVLETTPAILYACAIDPENEDEQGYPPTFISDNITQALGYRPDDILGNPGWWMSILHPEDRQNAVEETAIVFETEHLTHEYRVRNTAGEYRWVRDEMVLVPDEDGQPVEIVGSWTDITPRKQMEAAERDQRAFAEALVRIGSVLNRTLNLDEVLDLILDTVEEVVPHEGANIMLIESGMARVVRCHGAYLAGDLEDQLLEMEFEVGEFESLRQLTGLGTPLAVPDVREYPGWVTLPGFDWVRSYLGAPIYANDQIIGILNLDSSKRGAFTPVHAERLKAIADQAAIAIRNARVHQTIQERTARLMLLTGISQKATSILDLDELLQEAVRLIDTTFEFFNVAILLIEDGELLLRAATHSLSQSLVGHLRFKVGGNGVTAWVAAHGEPLLLPNVSQDSRFISIDNTGRVKSELGVPIKLRDKVVGVLDVQSEELGGLSEVDVFTLQTIADQLAIAIRNARLYAAEQTRYRSAEILRNAIVLFTALTRPTEILEQLLEQVDQVAPYDSSSAQQLTEKGLTVVACRGFEEPNNVIGQQYPMDPAFPNYRVVNNRAPLDVEDVFQSYPHFQIRGEVFRSSRIRSWLGVPLIMRDRVIGMIALDRHEIAPFSTEEIELVTALANQAALAIEKAHLYEELENYNSILEQAVDERTYQLQQEKERAEAIFDSAADAILITDPAGNILSANPAFSRQTHYALDEVVGQPIMLLNGATDEDMIATLQKAVSEGSPWQGELAIRRRDGSEYEVLINVAPLRNQGELIGFVDVMHDISALKEVQRMKDSFVSTAAHELRTPLTSIRGFSEILLTRDLEKTRRQHYLKLINEQSVQLGEIIDDMLDLSRLESGRGLEIKHEPIDLASIVNEAIEAFTEVSPKHQINAQGFGSLPSVMGDAFRLAQVIRNLVSNAVKYSPEGGPIIIRAKNHSENLEIRVSDQGMGMTPEQQAHLFEKFYRAEPAASMIPGTGLGLTICKAIVEGHGGRIWAESEAGRGSTFIFSLPLVRE